MNLFAAGTTDAVIIAELARRSSEALTNPKAGSYKDAAHFIVLRDADGKERIEWLTQRQDSPARKYGTVILNDAKSFIAFFKKHATSDMSQVYGALNPAAFVAVLNDHGTQGASWRDHRALFTPTLSPEWMAWSKHDRQNFNGNEAFAYFVEENAPDFVKPDAAAMLAMALNFRIKQGVQFDIAQRLDDGNVDLVYRNTVNATGGGASGKLRIPEQFTIELRVWDGPEAKKYKVEARFRYRLSEGALTLKYELVRPARVVEAAFKDLWADIEKGTGTTVLYGSPEGK